MVTSTHKSAALAVGVLSLLTTSASAGVRSQLRTDIPEGQACIQDEVATNHNKGFMDIRWMCDEGLECVSVRLPHMYRGNGAVPGEVQPIGICTKPLNPENGENPCYKLANGIYPGFYRGGDPTRCPKEKPRCDPTVTNEGGHLERASNVIVGKGGSLPQMEELLCKEVVNEEEKAPYIMYHNIEAF